VAYKADLKPKLVRRDRDHFILLKGTIHEEVITIVNIHELNISIPTFIKINTIGHKSTD
jgi:hypothetical protein